jgi:hypothetical protein
LDLVIHVHQNRNVDRTSWQLRIVRLTKIDHNVLQPLDPTIGESRTT